MQVGKNCNGIIFRNRERCLLWAPRWPIFLELKVYVFMIYGKHLYIECLMLVQRCGAKMYTGYLVPVQDHVRVV